MREPARETALNTLIPDMAIRVAHLLELMKHDGFDPVVFEARRSIQRQRWLYGQGRTKLQCIRAGISPLYARKGNIVTWTLKSEHLKGQAVDIISEKHGWGSVKFFAALKAHAKQVGLHVIRQEQCHVQL